MKTLALISVIFAFIVQPAHALVLEGVEYVVMKDKDGDEERIKAKSEGDRFHKSNDIIYDIPAKLSKKTFRCDFAKETPWRLERKVESQLELQGMIDALTKMPKPRKLSEAQVKMLNRVPVCEPYLLQLKVISRLINGWDIVRVQKLNPQREEEKSD